MSLALTLPLFLLAFPTEIASAQDAPPQQAGLESLFEVPDGMEVTLFAESPLLYNPTAMAFDRKGRLWVTEAVNYRQWEGKNKGKHFDQGDRVVVLEDSDGDGVADKSTVFAQDSGLTAPLGICVLEDRVLVSCSPNLYEYRDLDGDLVADTRTTLLTGFGGHDHDHGLHSCVVLPDGDLMFAVGNAGPHLVEDKHGFHLRSGSSYRGGGQFAADNHPGLVSDDGRIWTGGLIVRMHPDGSGLRVMAHNFRNNYEGAVDSFGDIFVFDNDDDGNQGCRIVSIVDGGNYGYFSADGSRFWGADRRPGQETLSAHWHQLDPGVMPLGTGTGSGGPTGVTVYEGEMFPQLVGTVLNADAGRSLVYTHEPVIEGAALSLKTGILIQPAYDKAGDRGHWFRPSDVTVAPDGSIYVADWYDPGVGGHWAGDHEAYGRILRLHGPAHSPLPPAQQEARALFPRAKTAIGLTAFRAEFDPTQHGERHRVAAYRAWTWAHGVSLEAATALQDDPSPFVRARVAASLRDLGGDAVEALWMHLAEQGPLDDRVYLECLGLGADGKEEALFSRLLTSGWQDRRLLPLVWRLHPAAALPWLQAFAADGHFNREERKLAVDAIAFMPTQAAADAMVLLALSGPEDLRETAAFWLRQRRENDWRDFGIEEVLRGDFDHATRAWQGELHREPGVEDFTIELDHASVVWLVVDDGGDGNSCDWADWLDVRFEVAGASKAASEATWIEAEAGWGSVQKNANCVGKTLQVGGKGFATGIGTHAPSRIAIQVPPGATRLSGSCAADDGGTSQGGATSLRFSIYVESRRDAAAVAAQEQAALNGDVEVATTLAGRTEGALFLLAAIKDKSLPEAVTQAVAPLLSEHADLSVRALASEVFPPTLGDGFPPLSALVDMAGDPYRGQELFRGRGTCFSCHSVRGLGGSIGPDLSNIRDKFGRDGLLDAIIHPSAAIAFGYDSWTLTLDDGRRLVGSLLADGERIVLRDSTGARQVFDAEAVVERVHQERSLMPPAASLGLSSQDLADLAAFLLRDPNAAPTFGAAQRLFNGKDLSGWAFQLPEGTDPATVWQVEDGVLHCQGQPIGYLYTEDQYTDFELELDWRGDPAAGPGNSGVLLRVQEPHKVWPRSIEAQLQSGSAGDIWNIDQFPLLVDAARTSGRHTVKLQPSNERPLGEWNHYRILVHGDQVKLWVNGELQNTASWAAHWPGAIALQSEGAVIEFRDIVLRPILN